MRGRVSIEGRARIGGERYVGLDGGAIGMSQVGASAPAKILYEKFGLTPQRMADEALRLIKER